MLMQSVVGQVLVGEEGVVNEVDLEKRRAEGFNKNVTSFPLQACSGH